MKRFAFSVLLAWALLATAVLAKDFPMTASPAVPSAKGKVSVDKDKNGNRKVKVEVKFLAQPSALTPPQTGYVVWIQARGKDPENLGFLKVNGKLDGELQATTPYDYFDIFVTGEGQTNPTGPAGPEVLRASVQP
jgi:hypothetical protein